MTIAIMQPYFLPYIGYFQLINAVDRFVIYDNVQYTKKGWINRNRILSNGKAELISLPLKKGTGFLHIDQRTLADTFADERRKTLRKIHAAYHKAPHFQDAFLVVEKLFEYDHTNLFLFLYNSLLEICRYLEIETEFIVSSALDMDHGLKSEEKVLAICHQLNANIYINPIGGTALYTKDHFYQQGIELRFLRSNPVAYAQFGHDFIPFLSILDVMMFNSLSEIKNQLNTAFSIITE